MRQYDLSLRRKGALVTLEHAQTYLELMYGLDSPAVSDAHFLMMTCAKDVIRGARSYSYSSFWYSKDKPVPVYEPDTMERLSRKVRRFLNKLYLWQNGYCTKHAVPKSHQWGWSCDQCLTEARTERQDKIQRIATEVKYGI